MTTVTILISKSFIFRSWLAMYNVPASTANNVFTLKLMRYSRACFLNGCFIPKTTQIFNEFLKQWYVKDRLKLSYGTFYGRNGYTVKQC